MKTILFISILSLIGACATEDINFKRRNVEEYFASSGIVQYFLPDLPVWANTVSAIQCHRQSSVRFFDFEKMKSSFGLSYQQIMQMQLAFNLEKNKSHGDKAMALTEEERLFYAVSERVQAGIVPFKIPEFKRLHLVVVDTFIKSNVYRELFSLVNSKDFSKGVPMFVSLCYNDTTVRSFMDQVGYKGRYEVIPASMFSPFASDGQLRSSMRLELQEFFGSDKEVILYIPKDLDLEVIEGKKTVKKF